MLRVKDALTSTPGFEPTVPSAVSHGISSFSPSEYEVDHYHSPHITLELHSASIL
jgi:hypothetical protein